MTDNCLSEISFNTLPQAIRDWIHEIGWKRENVVSCLMKYPKKDDNLIEVTVTGDKVKHFALFTELDDKNWKKVLE